MSRHFFKEDIQMTYRHKHTLEISGVWFQITSIKANIKGMSYKFFGFSGHTEKLFLLYTVIKCVVALCLRKQCIYLH